jgi:hypothetical protein
MDKLYDSGKRDIFLSPITAKLCAEYNEYGPYPFTPRFYDVVYNFFDKTNFCANELIDREL